MRESNKLEFKEQVSNSFLKTVSAYANYETGEIVFGINDAGQTIGIENLRNNCLQIENKINDAIHPAPRFSIETNEKKKTIRLTVFEGPFKPYLYREKAYKRNDTSTLPVDRLEFNRLIMEGQNLTYDQLTSQNQDLHFGVLSKKLQETLGVTDLSDDVMRTLGLKNSDLNFTNAAALLADSNSFKGVQIVKYGANINEIQDRRDLSDTSIISQLEEATQVYEQYYCYEFISGPQRQLVERVPRDAFREALANALVHRTWDVQASISLAMYPEKIEITSLGGLPSGLTEADYLRGDVSIPRNPILSNVFFRLRYIEQLGRGVARILATYQGKSVQPHFDVRPNSIKVELPVLEDVISLTKDEKAVLSALGIGLVLSRKEIGKAVGFSKEKTLRILSELEKRGLIRKTGSGRATRYSK